MDSAYCLDLHRKFEHNAGMNRPVRSLGYSALKALLIFGLLALVSGPERARASNIINMSTRILAETGDDVIVMEFVVRGSGTKYMILRGIGPSLIGFGIPDALRDPVMTLLDARGSILDSNDNWVDSPDKEAIIATGIPPTDRRESAIVHTFAPGIYTVVVRGVRGTTGVALAETYDLSSSDQTTVISGIGTRGFVSIADHVIISGVIVAGSAPLPVLLRALGASLGDVGISAPLADPVLELHDGNGALIALNDNWRDLQEAEIVATGLAPDNDRESAIVATLAPGAYTAIVGGLNKTTGTGFVQFYSLAARVRELNPAPRIWR